MIVKIRCNKPIDNTPRLFPAKCLGVLEYEGGTSPSDALLIINRFFEEHVHVPVTPHALAPMPSMDGASHGGKQPQHSPTTGTDQG